MLYRRLVFLALYFLFPTNALLTQARKPTGIVPGNMSSVLSNAEMGLLNINNISAWVRRDGWSGRNPTTGNPGIFYPRGTAGAVFQDGIVWGGVVNDTRRPTWPHRRVGGFTYSIGTRQGWVVTPGTPTTYPVVIDPNHPRARLYKICRDYQSLTVNDPGIIMEAAEFNDIAPGLVTPQMAQTLVDQYALDWNQWPGDLGAPFYDLNANGTWDPGVDRPGLQNADQVIWFVTNDADSSRTYALYGSPPLYFEVQTTLWGYKADGVFGQSMYRRTRLVNKSGFQIDSMYLCQWSDPDLGDAGDDFAGCDTVLNTAFVYNAHPIDNEYAGFGLPPAALGYALLQGPIVPTGNTQDTALFDFRRISGARNRRMDAQVYDAAGDGISFPPFTYEGTQQWFNLFKGLLPISGAPFIHPAVPGPTTFWLDGDPLTSSGRIDGLISGPGDRSIGMSTGPFTMANGDSQEVVIALVGGIRHTGNHLTSFAEMKQNTSQLRSFYGKQFDVPDVSRWAAYPTDTTTQLYVRADLRTQIGVSGSQIGFTPEAGSEQGFNLQLFDDGVHNDSLAADGIWGNSVVRRNQKYPLKGDLVIQTSGGPLTFAGLYSNVALRPMPQLLDIHVVWENGRQDSSLNHNETIHASFTLFNPDGVNAIDTPRVTNFAPGVANQVIVYNASIPPRGVASDPSFFLIVHGPSTGNTQNFSYRIRSDYSSSLFTSTLPVIAWVPGPHWGDTLQVTSIRGVTYNVKPVIADAMLLNGHTYVMTFFQGVSDLQWRLRDQSTGQLRHDNGVISALPEYPHPIIDGVQYRVIAVSPSVQDFRCVADARGPRPDSLSQGAFLINGSGFPSTLGLLFDRPEPNLGGARWGIHTGNNIGTSFDYHYANFVARVFRGGITLPGFGQYDYEMRFTAAGGLGYLAFTSGLRISVPFELWNTGIGTPNNPADDFRMIPLLNDFGNNDGIFNLDRIDHTISGGDNDPETDWIYWYEPLNRTPGQTGYNTWVSNPDPEADLGDEVMARITLVNLNGGSVNDPGWPLNVNQQMCETGMIFRILSTKYNIAGDSLRIIATPTSIPIGGIPLSVYLDQNYPNPFNPTSTIQFGLTARANVELSVYNVLGQTVRTLVRNEMQPGNHKVQWDSRNDVGRTVATGVYFYRLKVGEFVQVRKMLLLK